MDYALRAFDGEHCAHCAARDEFNRLARKREETLSALARRAALR